MTVRLSYIYYSIVFLYLILSWIGISNHEIWLDEAHHWLLARESESFQDLLYNTRYEGHPIIWSSLLYLITRFATNILWMQIFHILISTITVYVFLKKAPFSILFKIFFIFGYFMLFEYNLLSRNYMLGVLFLFLALSFYQNRQTKFLQFTLFLTLASNVHLIFLVISSILIFIVFLEHIESNTIFESAYYSGYILFSLGLLFAIIQIVPPSDTVFFDEINKLTIFKRFYKGYIAVWKGLIVIPDFRTIHFWNTNIFININRTTTVILGFIAYFIPLVIFYKNKKILLFVYLAVLGANLYLFITQRGNARSEGMVFLILIIGLWIEHYNTFNPSKLLKQLSQKLLFKSKWVLIYTILIIHMISGLIAYSIDYQYDFTPARKVVNYLKYNGFQKKTIITILCDAPISSYLEGKTFSLCTNRFESYCHWNINCNTDVLYSNIELQSSLLSFLINQNSSCILITVSPFLNIKLEEKVWKVIHNKINIRLLTKMNKSIIKNRDYYIYEVKRLKHFL